MVCEQCGSILPDGMAICPQCGAVIRARQEGSGLSGRRQGRPEKTAAQRMGSLLPIDDSQRHAHSLPAASLRRPRSGVDRGAATDGSRPLHRDGRAHAKPVKKRMVNWALLGTIGILVAFLAVAGGYAFLKFTDRGQLIMARRMGREDVNANALWQYGQELLDNGDITPAIRKFELAYEKEPDREDIYDRLLQLADAYEVGERMADAERIYTKLYTDVDKTRTDAYTQMIRLLESQERRMELATFLQVAYDNTGDNYFRRQREEILPSMPTADEEAGPRLREQDVQLISAEDYEIYYILGDEGNLPEDGTLYTQPIHLTKGTHILRAVAVSSDLVSDELRLTYTIRLPSPTAPQVSLAPGTYEKRQKVRLKYVPAEDEKNTTDEKQKDITIYYTVDSQTPTSNSPIYDGEPFLLPLGSCVLKAVAVNGYGEVSNVMEHTYKITAGTFKKFFNESDNFSDFVIMKTTQEAFVNKYGVPLEETEIEDLTMSGDCVKLVYSWGEARFCLTESGRVIYFLETTSGAMTGPRKTKLGMSEKDITELYRDMGQAHDQNGDRSLYYDGQYGNYGKLYHLDAFNDRIDYAYTRADTNLVTISYHLENSRVVKMTIKCGIGEW